MAYNEYTNLKQLKTVLMDCPMCGKKHDVPLMSALVKSTIKGVEVEYESCFYVCEYGTFDGDNTFCYGGMMNINTQNARKAYAEKVAQMSE